MTPEQKAAKPSRQDEMITLIRGQVAAYKTQPNSPTRAYDPVSQIHAADVAELLEAFDTRGAEIAMLTTALGRMRGRFNASAEMGMEEQKRAEKANAELDTARAEIATLKESESAWIRRATTAVATTTRVQEQHEAELTRLRSAAPSNDLRVVYERIENFALGAELSGAKERANTARDVIQMLKSVTAVFGAAAPSNALSDVARESVGRLADWAALRAENERLRRAAERVLAQYKPHEICDAEAELRDALASPQPDASRKAFSPNFLCEDCMRLGKGHQCIAAGECLLTAAPERPDVGAHPDWGPLWAEHLDGCASGMNDDNCDCGARPDKADVREWEARINMLPVCRDCLNPDGCRRDGQLCDVHYCHLSALGDKAAPSPSPEAAPPAETAMEMSRRVFGTLIRAQGENTDIQLNRGRMSASDAREWSAKSNPLTPKLTDAERAEAEEFIYGDLPLSGAPETEAAPPYTGETYLAHQDEWNPAAPPSECDYDPDHIWHDHDDVAQSKELLLSWMQTRPGGVYQSSIQATEFKRLTEIVAQFKHDAVRAAHRAGMRDGREQAVSIMRRYEENQDLGCPEMMEELRALAPDPKGEAG